MTRNRAEGTTPGPLEGSRGQRPLLLTADNASPRRAEAEALADGYGAPPAAGSGGGQGPTPPRQPPRPCLPRSTRAKGQFVTRGTSGTKPRHKGPAGSSTGCLPSRATKHPIATSRNPAPTANHSSAARARVAAGGSGLAARGYPSSVSVIIQIITVRPPYPARCRAPHRDPRRDVLIRLHRHAAARRLRRPRSAAGTAIAAGPPAAATGEGSGQRAHG